MFEISFTNVVRTLAILQMLASCVSGHTKF